MPDIVHGAKVGISGGTAETGIRFELPDKQQHTASFLPVMDIPLSGGRIFGCGALALPVKQVLVDGIIVVHGGGRVILVGFVQGHKEHIQLLFRQPLHTFTRLVVVTHASNVTGNLTDLAFVSTFAKKHGLTLVMDAAQTVGARPIDVQALGVDVLCFTGHKALLGPQGTGGLYVRPGLTMAPLVVGGSGIHSFDETHPSQMPTALEAGTLNVPGLAGLGVGVEWILSQGVEVLHEKEMALTRLFYEKIVHAPDVKIYGSFDETDRAPIVSLNFGDADAARAADILWEDYGICVRAGAHCAPLIHKALANRCLPSVTARSC